MQNGRGIDGAAHVPQVVNGPPVRCYHTDGNSRYAICGELARWKRPGNHWFDDAYFCDRHRAECDEPIVGELVVRRVRLTVDVLFAGASRDAPFAQTEAVQRLERVLASAGAVVEIHEVRSNPVRYRSQAAAGGAIGPSASQG